MDDILCAVCEFFASLLPKNNRFMKRINCIQSRFLRNAVKVLLFLLAVSLICCVCFLISRLLRR